MDITQFITKMIGKENVVKFEQQVKDFLEQLDLRWEENARDHKLLADVLKKMNEKLDEIKEKLEK